MNKFLRTQDIIFELRNIIESAKKELVLVSPYWKLDNNVKIYLKSIKKLDNLRIIVIYGKNPENQSRSLSENDKSFLLEFPNVEIYYLENLHAKFYANENKAIITSMNLYGYSKDNTEFGILLCADKNDKLFSEAKEYIFNYLIGCEVADLEYPDKKYCEKTTEKQTANEENNSLSVDGFYLGLVQNAMKGKNGYCIKTGEPIPFDLKNPFCKKSYNEWQVEADEKERGNFCHLSGENSKGRNSKEFPILHKNWKKLIMEIKENQNNG